ncbi:unnamed protein product [Parnassius apollo]|uniref:(apollo) hypothetical protein n=1 Tax=Parnassius apollo TaxID=110799 RepID=A0A8S3W0H9_PARAO|nr:unnamed protein product [Parnassius apollo]
MFKSFQFIYLAITCIGSGNAILAKNCDDCVLITSCPGALHLAVHEKNAKTEGLIKQGLCSLDQENGLPKVCCSEFPPAPEEIDNHPNLDLLPKDCGEIEGSRIVGGEVAKLYEFPWMVLISYKTRIGHEFLCAGSLISPLYVLTAAHCINGRRIAGVRIGDYDWKSKVDCEKGTELCESYYQDIGVSETLAHPAYQGPPIVRNDIGLLRLKKPVNVTVKNAGVICLPVTKQLRERRLDTEQVTVAGWGITENNTASSVLLKVNLPVLSGEMCKAYYSRKTKEDTTKNILCAGMLGKDSCKGDSGGPLMLEGNYNDEFKFIQYGIVSYGPSQCGSNFPGVYTDVSWFMKWILDTIKP